MTSFAGVVNILEYRGSMQLAESALLKLYLSNISNVLRTRLTATTEIDRAKIKKNS